MENAGIVRASLPRRSSSLQALNGKTGVSPGRPLAMQPSSSMSTDSLHHFDVSSSSSESLHSAIKEAVSHDDFLGAGAEAGVFHLDHYPNYAIRISRKASIGWLDGATKVQNLDLPENLERQDNVSLPVAALQAGDKGTIPHSISSISLRHGSDSGSDLEQHEVDAVVIPRLRGKPLADAFADQVLQLYCSKAFVRQQQDRAHLSALREIQRCTLSASERNGHVGQKIDKLDVDLGKIAKTEKEHEIFNYGKNFLRHILTAEYTSAQGEPYGVEKFDMDLHPASVTKEVRKYERLAAAELLAPANMLDMSPKGRIQRRFQKKYNRMIAAYSRMLDTVTAFPPQAYDEALQLLGRLRKDEFGIDMDHGGNLFVDLEHQRFQFIDIALGAAAKAPHRSITLERFLLALAGRDRIHTWKSIVRPADVTAVGKKLQIIVDNIGAAARRNGFSWNLNDHALEKHPSHVAVVEPDVEMLAACRRLIEKFGLVIT